MYCVVVPVLKALSLNQSALQLYPHCVISNSSEEYEGETSNRCIAVLTHVLRIAVYFPRLAPSHDPVGAQCHMLLFWCWILGIYWPLCSLVFSLMRSSVCSQLLKRRKFDALGAECGVCAPFPFPQRGVLQAVWTAVFFQRKPTQNSANMNFTSLSCCIFCGVFQSSFWMHHVGRVTCAVGSYTLYQPARGCLVVTLNFRSTRGASVSGLFMLCFIDSYDETWARFYEFLCLACCC